MAIKFGNDLDLEGNQIKNFIAHSSSVAPLVPKGGMLWWDNVNKILKCYNESISLWKSVITDSEGGGVLVSDYLSLADAVAQLGATPVTLYINSPQTISVNLVIPSTLSLRVISPNIITIDNGVTLTINGPLSAGLYKIFEGTGNVVFGPGSIIEAYPQWWGALADGINNDGTAIQKALNSFGNIYFPAGTYMFTTALLVYGSTHIIGAGADLAILKPTNCNGLEFQHSGSTSPVNIKDFTIDGGSNTTGIAIRYLGPADNLQRIWGGRINNIRIQNINTAIYLRTANNIEISGCRFWKVYNGIKAIGQIIVGRVHDNDIEFDAAMGVGTSYGIYVDSAFDYDPGGITEHTPEDIQIHQNRFFGFDYGAYLYRGLFWNIECNDFDYCKDYGIYGSTLTGNCVIRGNWISMSDINAVAGIYLEARAAAANKVTVIRENVLNAIVATAACDGIVIRENQNSFLIDANNFSGFAGSDIYLNDVVDGVITNNYCYSNVTYSLNLHPFNLGKLNGHIKVDGNYFRGSFYCYPANLDADIDMGFNQGLYSTRIKGKVQIALNATSGSVNYSALRPTPANIPADTTGFEPKLIIHGPAIDLGYTWGIASETGVTVNCSSSSHAATYVYWEVVLFPLAL